VPRLSQRLLLTLMTVISLCLSLTAQASLFGKSNPFANDGPLPVEEAYTLTHDFENGELKLFWSMPDSYYLYQNKIEVKGGDNVEVGPLTTSPSKEKDDPLFGRVQVYYTQAQASVNLTAKGDSVSNTLLKVTYQGCWEGGICYPPVTKELSVGPVPPAGAMTASMPAAAVETASVVPMAQAAVPVSEQGRFAALLEGGNLALIMGAFFVAGLALSLTPCVFPMIPILSSIIAGQKAVTTSKAFTLSLVYVLTVSVTYTIAGVLAGLSGENLQAAFQNPWVLSSFALIFVALSFSMFGFYELQLPNAIQSRLAAMSNRQQGGQYSSVVVMGFLSALIVGPCMAAPLAGALIFIGERGDAVLGGAALFSLSIGMGIPLLIVGASAGKLLPKAGAWMDSVKAGFGVLLLLMAVYMLDRIVSTQVTMALTALVLIVSAVYMRALDRLPEGDSGWQKLWKGFGLVMLVYGVALMVGVFSGGRSMVYPLQGIGGGTVAMQSSGQVLPFNKVTSVSQLEPLLAQAKANNQRVMLDFYADWCVSCDELEFVTFADGRVQQALSDYMLIKVDVTANDDASRELNQRYDVIGPPSLVFYNTQGLERSDAMIVGVVSADEFLKHLTDFNI